MGGATVEKYWFIQPRRGTREVRIMRRLSLCLIFGSRFVQLQEGAMVSHLPDMSPVMSGRLWRFFFLLVLFNFRHHVVRFVLIFRPFYSSAYCFLGYSSCPVTTQGVLQV
ncbi:unnamed protein product [Ectocarpus sp. 6 AP-2014]